MISMDWKRRESLVAAGLCTFLPLGSAATRPRLDGHFRKERMASLERFTLPRTFLYDSMGVLVERERWPDEFVDVKRDAGDAFCCVSDSPPVPGSSGWPPDCKIITYGQDVHENFNGLLDSSDQPIQYGSIPQSKFLLVEYFALWCPPCLTERRALDALFRDEEVAKKIVWLSIDMTGLIEAQSSAKAKM